MKKYKVEVEIIKTYEVEIDENIINNEFIEEFEECFHDLNEEDDKYKSIARDICEIRAQDLSYEGYGYPLECGKSYFDDDETQKGINFIEINEDYCDATVSEMENL